MKTTLFAATVAALSISALAPSNLSAATIDFDDAPAPCLFGDQVPLTDQYQSLGITFSGGGEVLNQCAGFGITARSGLNFLAFNASQGSTVELAFFSNPQTTFSLYNGASSANLVTLTAFNSLGTPVGVATTTNLPGQYSQLSFASATPFSLVRLDNSASLFVYDDLGFGGADSAVPEPGAWAMMIIGFGAVGGMMRTARRTRKTVAA